MGIESSFQPGSLGRDAGLWLRGLRCVRGLSPGMLAERSGLPLQRIEMIENGLGPLPDLGELAAVLAAIDPKVLERLAEFALTLGAAANSIEDANQLSGLASRIVAAFGGVPSTATRHAVADLVEAIAGYGPGRRLNS
ncbi:helix-turn-helix domain-containing protein [Zavarzinia compransoris]|uniref:helix-turn-helix domain-containing protein n=1 Tax=Zavarzinia compransoris TaxID=1264899 RepID=UPI00105DFA1B|nr:helix-turn-helix transcriptional regulator [Zavarzinia compransoris]TDP49052.1 hypothetical protein DES42_101413 [Zavarzinia compransoris]